MREYLDEMWDAALAGFAAAVEEEPSTDTKDGQGEEK
jgi:hypothetical protein